MKTNPSTQPVCCSARPVSLCVSLVFAVGLLAGTSLPQKTLADEARVVPLPESLTARAELPAWPIGFNPPNIEAKEDAKGNVTTAVLAWIPPQSKQIRAVFVIPNNSDSKHVGEHARVREVAAKHDMAIVYLRMGDIEHIQGVLDMLAAETGIKEFVHAPWIPFGKSSRGRFPINIDWQYSKRALCSVSYHAETPPWPPEGEATKEETILHVNINGESEWGGTWFKHVRPSLLNYRRQTAWLPHLVVANGVGHGDYPDANGSEGWGKEFTDRMTCIRIWDYIAVYLDKALTLRLPAGEYPTDGPLDLVDVDPSCGYLIDPFAVEDLYKQPHYRLVEENGVYLSGAASEPATVGFIAVAPAADYAVPEGVPVVPLAIGSSPTNWLMADVLRFAMKQDPMTELGDLAAIRPVPGDKVSVEDHEITFAALDPKRVKPSGGISLSGLKNWGESISLLAYTVMDVPESTCVKLEAPFSVAGRLQIVLNGTPVRHKQVIELQKGLYPMLVVLSLNGPNWGGVTPFFVNSGDEEVQEAKAVTAEEEQRKAERARLLAEGNQLKKPLIRPFADVPEEERRDMFWVADREQAEAWFKLHAIHGQTFE